MYENSFAMFISDSIFGKNFSGTFDTRETITYQIQNTCAVNVVNLGFPGQTLQRNTDRPWAIGYGVDQENAISGMAALGLANLFLCLGYNDWAGAIDGSRHYYQVAIREFLGFATRCTGVQNITVISPLSSPGNEDKYTPSTGVPGTSAFLLSDYRFDCLSAVSEFQGLSVPVHFIDGPSLVNIANPDFWESPHLTGLGHIELARNIVSTMQGWGIFPNNYTS